MNLPYPKLLIESGPDAPVQVSGAALVRTVQQSAAPPQMTTGDERLPDRLRIIENHPDDQLRTAIQAGDLAKAHALIRAGANPESTNVHSDEHQGDAGLTPLGAALRSRDGRAALTTIALLDQDRVPLGTGPGLLHNPAMGDIALDIFEFASLSGAWATVFVKEQIAPQLAVEALARARSRLGKFTSLVVATGMRRLESGAGRPSLVISAHALDVVISALSLGALLPDETLTAIFSASVEVFDGERARYWPTLCKLFNGHHFDQVTRDCVVAMLTQGQMHAESVVEGEPLLHIACKSNNLDAVHILLTHGADPAALNSHGEGCLDLCRRYGVSTTIVQLLLAAQAQHAIVRIAAQSRVTDGRTSTMHLALAQAT